MKLKVLGMCAIASLLYGENVFADEVQSQENLNGNNTTATQDENSGFASMKINSQTQDLINNNTTTTQDENSNVSENTNDNQNALIQYDKPTHSFNLIKKFVEQSENSLSRLARKIEEFKHDASFYEKKMTRKDQLNMVENLNKTKENLIDVLNDNIANFEYMQKILQDLKIDEKIKWLQDQYNEIEPLLKNVDIEDMKDLQNTRAKNKKEQKRKKQEAAEKRKKREESRRPSERAGQDIDWQMINGYRDDLFKFIEMIGLRKLDFNSLITYGNSCFGHEDGLMFDPGQNGVDPMLKNVLMQIYEVSFPEAEKAWSETKEMIRKADEFVSAFSSERSKLNEEISKAKEKIAKSSKALAKKTKLENDLRNNKRLPQKQKESKEQEIAGLNNQIISTSEERMTLDDLEKKESRVKELENMISGAYRDLKLENLESKIKTLGRNVASLLKQQSSIDEKKLKTEEGKKKMEEAIKREELGEGNGYEE